MKKFDFYSKIFCPHFILIFYMQSVILFFILKFKIRNYGVKSGLKLYKKYNNIICGVF